MTDQPPQPERKASTPALPVADSLERFGFRLRHVGVAVPELGRAASTLASLFGYRLVSGPYEDPVQRVTVSFLQQNANDAAEIELIAPAAADSPIRGILAKGTAAYHLCFETTDLDGALVHMRQHGCVQLAEPVPAVAFGGSRIAWIYSPDRQLFELVEAPEAARHTTATPPPDPAAS